MKNQVIVVDGDKHIIDFKPVFEMLNSELAILDISLELICAGGYVMQLHGYRATADIDAFFTSCDEIDRIIYKVGEKFKINRADELWLNNSISNLNTEPLEEYCEVIYRFSHLTVKAVSLVYLIGMKLKSGREQDLSDVASLIKAECNKQPLELMSQLNNIGFIVDISDLLDTYGTAHGIDWLESFYGNNQKEISKYF